MDTLLVSVGGATSIPDVINANKQLPLINNDLWQAYLFEIFIIETFNTQTAVLGVSIFFLVTGYLMSEMTFRYNRAQFLLNRFYRIFPTLITSILLIGLWVFYTQGISFNFFEYLSSITLSYQFTRVKPVSGVLWTLVVECIFYFIVSMMGRINIKKLLYFQFVLLSLIISSSIFYEYYFIFIIGFISRFLLMISIGMAIYLSEQTNSIIEKVLIIACSLFFSYMGFIILSMSDAPLDESSYNNLGTHLTALIVFLVLKILNRYNLLFFKIYFVKLIAKLVYPIYLLHVSIGLSMIEIMRDHFKDPYLLVMTAFICTLFFAYLLHKIIEVPSIILGKKISQQL